MCYDILLCVLQFAALHCIVWIVMCCHVLQCGVMCFDVLCCAVLCCDVLCFNVLRCVFFACDIMRVLHCVVL